MHLESHEEILKVYRHHPLPFVVNSLGIAFLSLPFILVASFFKDVLSNNQMVMVYSVVFLVFAIAIFHYGVIYFLDKLIVTNRRVIHIDWKTLFLREENEAEFKDIEDIETREFGILSFLKIFDFGVFTIETASGKSPIVFKQTPDPEGIKHFIYHLQIKPSKIETDHTHYNNRHDSEVTINAESNVSK